MGTYCKGHALAETRDAVGHPVGTVRVILFDGNTNEAVEVRLAKSMRGANRIIQNWSKRRGPTVCTCVTGETRTF